VLLRNEKNLLPLRKDLKVIAVLGPLADDRDAPLGPWRGAGRPEDAVTVLQGIKNQAPAGTRILHAPGCEISGSSTAGFAEAERLARQAEVVVLAVGEDASMSGEAASRARLDLPGVQEDLVRTIHATGKPVVMVLMNGRPLTIPWAADHLPAILETWFLGVQHGNAVADVLFGAVNPSGKLPTTFPRAVGQLPLYYNHKNTGRPETEDRFTSKFTDISNSPVYPFGHGLSYTTFAYTQLQLSKSRMTAGDSLRVSVEVKNTGTRKGDEVAQLYVRDEVGSVTRPVKELKGFRHVQLEVGETRQVVFSLRAGQLAFYDRDMKLTVEPGSFKVYVGGNSMQLLEAGFEVVAE